MRAPGGLPFSHDATSLAAAEMWNLTCPDGEFDISFHPSGFRGGYAQLAVNSHRLRRGEVDVIVADLADAIRSKEPACRPKDLRVLPLLYHHQSARRAAEQTMADLGPADDAPPRAGEPQSRRGTSLQHWRSARAWP